MKKIVILVIFAFFIKMDGMAQPGQQSGVWMSGGQHFIVQHGEALQLTDDQKKEILAVSIEGRTERRFTQQQNRRDGRGAVRGNRQINQREAGVRGSGRGLYDEGRFEYRAEMQQKLNEILTAEQREKLDAIRTERINSMDEIRTLRHEVMIEKAGLEGEKAARVKELLDNHATGRPAWAGATDREEMLQLRRERREEMTDIQNELKQLLTAAEYERLQSFMMQGQPVNSNRNRAPGFRNR